MRDTFSDIFFDGMKGELKSLGDYWTAFSTAVKRQIADMAASWVMSGLFGKSKDGGGGGLLGKGIGLLGNLFTSFHDGGLVKMHSGGQASSGVAVLKEKEFVIQDSSTRSLGTTGLNYANKTGKWPQSGGNVTNIHHSYTIVAMDSESMDQALRRGGAKAIQDISVGSYAFEKERRNPIFAR